MTRGDAMSSENLEEHMKYHEAMGERAYSLMYDAFSGTAAAGYYSDVKHEFAEAIRFAREAGRADEVSGWSSGSNIYKRFSGHSFHKVDKQ
jgi:hypothetical protein